MQTMFTRHCWFCILNQNYQQRQNSVWMRCCSVSRRRYKDAVNHTSHCFDCQLNHSPQKRQDTGSDTSSSTHSCPGFFGPRTGGRYWWRSTRGGQGLFRDRGRCFMGGGSDFTVGGFRGLYVKSKTVVDENSMEQNKRQDESGREQKDDAK